MWPTQYITRHNILSTRSSLQVPAEEDLYTQTSYSRVIMLTKEEAAYLAGILDADGSIGRLRKRNGFRLVPSISVTKTDRSIIDWIQTRFPKSKVYARNPIGSQRKRYWIVKLTERETVKQVLSLVMPYLVLKRTHAALVMQMLNARAGKGIGDHYTDAELVLGRQYHELVAA